MKIQDITSFLETIAPLTLQEDYDNAGLLTGSGSMECTGIMVALDATPAVIREAVEKKCNLVVAHHPIVFRGLKKINGKNYVEESIISAIKNDVAIYAIHTNLDNVIHGVNGKMADMLGLLNRSILAPISGRLKKLAVFVPLAYREAVLKDLFAAGAGHIGQYAECSFSMEGTGTFMGMEGSNPFVGEIGLRHSEQEARVEVLYPSWLEAGILQAMRRSHPYEEVAYDIYRIDNQYGSIGAGLLGTLPEPMTEKDWLARCADCFRVPVIRHSAFLGKPIQKIALCGGAGSFLTAKAIAAGADTFLTADLKYHEFFDAGEKLLLADIGHFESEQFTTDLLIEQLTGKFPTFAVLKTGVNTNPVYYYQA